MSRSAKILALALVSALGLGALSRARAQEPEANGPAGATAVDPSTQEAPDDPTHAALRRSLAGPGELVQSEATPTIPAGSIRVTVVGPGGSPIEGAPIRIGVMAQAGGRRDVRGTTGADGIHVFTGLATGSAQAYRVNVEREGASTSSTPFRLEVDRGQDVRVTLLPTTHDARVLLQFLGVTAIELKPGRVHVQQAAELMNMSESLYVFPERGLHVRLPEGHLAFQSADVMTDQHITPAGDGFDLTGSIPPGRVQLTWAFDLPLGGGELAIDQPIAFAQTYVYRVISDAADGMSLEVEGFPPAQRFDADGRSLLGTQSERTPQDSPLRALHIRLGGIPGPGPLRWIAVALAGLFVLLGAFLATNAKSAKAFTAEARARRKEELLDAVATLERERSEGEVGPEYHARRRRELLDELALLLKLEARDGTPSEPTPARGK